MSVYRSDSRTMPLYSRPRSKRIQETAAYRSARRCFQVPGNGMKSSHINACLQQKGIFFFICPAAPDALHRRGNDVREQTLMLFIVIGKKNDRENKFFCNNF